MTVYFVQATCGSIKIGYTYATDPAKRVSGIQTSMPGKLTLLAYCPGNTADEKSLHHALEKDRINREWFRPSDRVMSLVAFVKQFNNCKDWEAAEENPAAWCSFVKEFGLPSETEHFRKVRQLPKYEYRWRRLMDRAGGFRPLASEAVEWSTLSNRFSFSAPWRNSAAPTSLRVKSEYPEGETICGWLCRESKHMIASNVGLRTTAEALSFSKNRNEEIAIWLLACIRSLSGRCDFARDDLLDKVPELEDIAKLAADHSDVSWDRLCTTVLPEAFVLPKRCMLSAHEFAAACATHARLCLTTHLPLAVVCWREWETMVAA